MRFITFTLSLAGILAATVSVASVAASPPPISQVYGPATQCGQLYKIEEEVPMPVYANGHYENLEAATHMIGFDNWSCGICMVFR
jgi:hypothetical protein